MNSPQFDEKLISRFLDDPEAAAPDLRSYLFGPPLTSVSDVASRDFRTVDPLDIRSLRTGDRWVHKQDSNLWFPDYRDARNYVFLKKEEFDEIIKQFNSKALEQSSTPLILSFFTGGTLSMIRSPDGVFRPAKDGSDLLDYAGHGLRKEATLGIIDTPSVDSADMRVMLISEIVGAYHYIYRGLSPEAKRLFAGVLIGHGTDTASDTGANIRAMHTAHNVSVGLVAAQRSADDPLPDGPSNIAATLRALIEMHKQGVAHLFCHGGGNFAGKLYGLGWFTKDTDKRLDIFGCRGYPIICDLGSSSIAEGVLGGPASKRADSERPPVLLDGFSPVHFFKVRQGDDPLSLVKDVLAFEKPYYVITSFGAGTISQATLQALTFSEGVLEEKAKRTGLPRQHIFVNTLFADADLKHAYESNDTLRRGGIPVLCATEEMITARAMVARAVNPDAVMQKRHILTPLNGDYPAPYNAHAQEHYGNLLLRPDEKEALFTSFRFTPVTP